VDVPGFDGAWMHSGKIDLTELAEMGITRSEHAHHFAPFVDDLSQWCYNYAVNHA
jgi:hypothetical protein